MRSVLAVTGSKDNVLDHLRGGEAYEAGRTGFMTGAADAPQHWGNNSRVAWWVGFLDARTRNVLGHIFAKYQINYP